MSIGVERTGLTCGAAIGAKLERSAECEVWTAECEDLVAAGQCSGGTAMNGSVLRRAGEGKAAVVRVSSLEEALGVAGGEGEEGS